MFVSFYPWNFFPPSKFNRHRTVLVDDTRTLLWLLRSCFSFSRSVRRTFYHIGTDHVCWPEEATRPYRKQIKKRAAGGGNERSTRPELYIRARSVDLFLNTGVPRQNRDTERPGFPPRTRVLSSSARISGSAALRLSSSNTSLIIVFYRLWFTYLIGCLDYSIWNQHIRYHKWFQTPDCTRVLSHPVRITDNIIGCWSNSFHVRSIKYNPFLNVKHR